MDNTIGTLVKLTSPYLHFGLFHLMSVHPPQMNRGFSIFVCPGGSCSNGGDVQWCLPSVVFVLLFCPRGLHCNVCCECIPDNSYCCVHAPSNVMPPTTPKSGYSGARGDFTNNYWNVNHPYSGADPVIQFPHNSGRLLHGDLHIRFNYACMHAVKFQTIGAPSSIKSL